ncbi:MAG: hypothetical protein EPN93_18945 [Spirochaetes bacterium]|nr:MAG: hypothetical protein EPN93_18945 [Spirochaetota bacterium]
MKKFMYLIIVCAILGAGLSALMLLDHYYPDAHARVISCGGGIADPCYAVSQSDFAAFLGVPVAAYGLFFYILIIFILLIADYAGGGYATVAWLFTAALAAAGLLADMALGAILVYMKSLCTICVFTYGINALIATLAALWYRSLRAERGAGIREITREILGFAMEPDRRAASSLFIVFIVLLFFAVFSTATILSVKTAAEKPGADDIMAMVNEFYSREPEARSLPARDLALGDEHAPVTIAVYTDFLCSACYKFYQVEKQVVARYRDNVRFTYYNFPLDRGCNEYIRHTKYQNSCFASRAFIAAARKGMFEEYLMKHFGAYGDIARRYTLDTALLIASSITDADAFLREIQSPRTDERLIEDLKLAESLAINATPTLFINGRRFEGVPPREVLFKIIEREAMAGGKK